MTADYRISPHAGLTAAGCCYPAPIFGLGSNIEMLQMFFDVGNIKQSEISRVEMGSMRSPAILFVSQFNFDIEGRCLIRALLGNCTLQESRGNRQYIDAKIN